MYISMTRTMNCPMHISHAKFFGGWGASPTDRLDEEAMTGLVTLGSASAQTAWYTV